MTLAARLRCPACGGPIPVHLYICQACTDTFLDNLAAVQELAADLDVAISRQTAMGDGGTGEPDTLWDERASQAAGALRSTLVGWVRVLQEGVQRVPAIGPRCSDCTHRTCMYWDLSRGPADTMADMARWLTRHHRALLRHPASEEAVDELREAVRQARRATDRPAPLWYAGPCNTPLPANEDDGEEVCQADLYAHHNAKVIICRACKAQHEAAYRMRWLLDRAADHLATATEIARLLSSYGVTAAMVRGYADRGRLAAHGTNRLGHPTYRIGDVVGILGGNDGTLGPACGRCAHPTCQTIRGERIAA